MAKFNWSEDFKIDNEIIDSQHRHLFDLANKVFESDSRAAITECALGLFQYIRQHFKDEESVMKQSGYPDYEKHIQAHDQILVRLEAISIDLKENQFRTDELNRLMVDWLLTHILKEDMLIGEFLRKK